jgi:hypothetical protein
VEARADREIDSIRTRFYNKVSLAAFHPKSVTSRLRGLLRHHFDGLPGRVRHAFAVAPEAALAPEDVVLLERFAAAVVDRGMAVPAVLFLESLGPVAFLGSQALHFFTPILEIALPQREVERVALLLERRDTLSRLATLIESRAQTRS